ncbi:hypothetical protein D477_000475 [Arthrobacter crystallopoietes BAB-32]|uniref:Uncharacterized protein n=1 Tax=Arthrobacter crystallopoietes BAB-32 TaxID=1246476 RepID=N1V0J5_9MICC|nr:hypothetical protein D477_000475 [Arthrobacter crystallopoietes BAB-32]
MAAMIHVDGGKVTGVYLVRNPDKLENLAAGARPGRQ